MIDKQTILFAETAIREFLAQRPESADTIEGIHRWWIRWPGLPESPVITTIALERLESAGVSGGGSRFGALRFEALR